MGADTKIEWTDHTFNPWIGCTKVSPGCAHCYAENLMDTRYGRVKWGKGQPRQRTSAANWKLPLKWDRAAALDATACAMAEPPRRFNRPRVFCASLADWLDDEVPVEWLADLLDLIRRTPNLDWLLLTKRPQNWRMRLPAVRDRVSTNSAVYDLVCSWLGGTPPPNVWVGTTVEDQTRADERIPLLLSIPARVRFLSCEPLLGPVNLERVEFGPKPNHTPQSCLTPTYMGRFDAKIHWVICGGESGPGARPMHPDWARSIRDQCQAVGVPYLFKQWGEWLPQYQMTHGGRTVNELPTHSFGDGIQSHRIGKHAAGRLLDGREWNEFPKGGG